MSLNTLQWRAKRLRYLLQRVQGSLTQRGLRKTWVRITQELQTRPTEESSLKLERLDIPFSPFEIPTSESPQVSVIIPVHGKCAWTVACLRSIRRHGARTSFEIIVVDDTSPDDTAVKLSQIRGIRLLQNQANLGFIGSCNAGAEIARAPFLLFLNNDTQVTPGWLDALLETYVEEPDCGIVGSQLIYPDGRLQEAGALVYSNAAAWNVGRFEKRNDPHYLYRRDVDYVSGAALLIEKTLFMEVGGFDLRYAPAYCEDMDLAFAVRARSRRVIYEPASVIVHCEGISSGTDVFTGIKQYQRINREKFVAKWSTMLQKQPAPDVPVDKAIHHHQKQHILIVDALMPDPTRDAGSLQVFNIMRLLRQMGWRVTFMADNRTATPRDVHILGAIGVEVLCKPWSPSLVSWLKRENDNLKAVMLCRHYVAAPNMSLIKELAPKARIIFDTEDLHFLRERRAAEHTGNASLSRQAMASQQQEFALMRASHATFVVSAAELDLLKQELPDANVMLLPNMHPVHGRKLEFEQRAGLVFVGGFGHPPNVDAVQWLTNDIYPIIRARRPDIDLHLIGDIPKSARTSLQGDGVVIHGRVEDLAPWLDQSRISLAPLRYGAGVKGKVNTAMSHGLPVVATSMAAEGMWLRNGDNALLADDAEGFAEAVLHLYENRELWYRLSEGGLRNIREHFSFEVARETLRRALLI
ncbi:glycosyltransferase [Dyella nitratireducens]|uniref:Glycosyl transferase family protein n=1 Tax=Dyella nitratireducens TaxID=1849580 RepID=A0ABQ1FPM1_9GAMM|nr:glycosyltransferase [Dyella nitratireducens]GGA25395.1 glycosyl transferase family protein [Dyella nitratireducens]GLQ43694.1 glycosyl transferase family protein [Dyella nitratireducens]